MRRRERSAEGGAARSWLISKRARAPAGQDGPNHRADEAMRARRAYWRRKILSSLVTSALAVAASTCGGGSSGSRLDRTIPRSDAASSGRPADHPHRGDRRRPAAADRRASASASRSSTTTCSRTTSPAVPIRRLPIAARSMRWASSRRDRAVRRRRCLWPARVTITTIRTMRPSSPAALSFAERVRSAAQRLRAVVAARLRAERRRTCANNARSRSRPRPRQRRTGSGRSRERVFFGFNYQYRKFTRLLGVGVAELADGRRHATDADRARSRRRRCCRSSRGRSRTSDRRRRFKPARRSAARRSSTTSIRTI